MFIDIQKMRGESAIEVIRPIPNYKALLEGYAPFLWDSQKTVDGRDESRTLKLVSPVSEES